MEEFLYLRKAKEEDSQRLMDALRWHSYQEMNLSPYIRPERKPRSPHAYCPFPWDAADETSGGTETVVGLTPEEEAELFRMVDGHLARTGRYKS